MATKIMILLLLQLLASQSPPPLTFNLHKQSIEELHEAMERALAPSFPAVRQAKWILVHADGQQALVSLMTTTADDLQAGRIPAMKAKAVAVHFHGVGEEEVGEFRQVYSDV